MADVELDVTFESSNVSLDTDFGTVYVIDGNVAVKVIADKYSNTSTYSVGTYVIYDGLLYRCTTAIDEPEEFDSEKWLNIKLADDVQSVKSALDTLSNVVDDKANSADVTSALANKMDKSNPTGSGSFSLNRKPGDIGSQSVTVGDGNTASGPASFAAGRSTVANHRSQHVFGEFNTPDDSTVSSAGRGNYIEIIGNGTGIRARSNARTLDWQGNEMLAGDLTFNGDKSLTSEISRLDNRITDLPEAMVFKGTLGVNGDIQTLPTASAEIEGWTFKCITAGTYAGLTLKVGDSVTCFNPPNTSVYEWDISGYGDTDTDTWRSIKINGEEALGSGISSGSVDFVGSENIDVEFDSDGNKIGVKTKNIYTKEEVDDIVYGILPDDTASGSVANFDTSLELPIKSLEVDVNAVQSAGTPTPDSPLPISGWSAINLYKLGGNFFDKDSVESGKLINGSGNEVSYADWNLSDYIEVVEGAGYYLYGLTAHPNTNQDNFELFNASKVKVGYANVKTNEQPYVIPSGVAYIKCCVKNQDLNTAQLGVSVNASFVPYDATLITEVINLGGTYYGGHFTQDKDGHRQLVVTDKLFTFSGNDDWQISTNFFYLPAGTLDDVPVQENATASNGFRVNPMTNRQIRLYPSYGINSQFISMSSTVEEIQGYLANGISFKYALATPIVIDLPDGEPIATLIGTNNIYADTGDTSVVFKDSVNGYVEKKIASVQALALNT